MRVRVVAASDLGRSEVERWSQLQESDPTFVNPYFRPEFTAAVGAVRDDVFVGLLEDGGSLAGFFPFQRGRFRIGTPVGGRLSDYQGVVAAADVSWDPLTLVRDCRLRAWDFDHLLASQASFRPYHRVISESPVMDLEAGFDRYCERIRARSRRIDRLERSARKLEREAGPVRFAWHVEDRRVLEDVIHKKSQQCRRAGVRDCFGPRWTGELIRRLAATQHPEFAGVLSVLYVGDRVGAAHFGMRSKRVLHWWFPVYDRALHRYSPGQILLLRAAEACAERGVVAIDLGKGEDSYKEWFRTSAVTLAEGSVCMSRGVVAFRRLRAASEAWLRRSPLRGPARRAYRAWRARREASGAEAMVDGARDV